MKAHLEEKLQVHQDKLKSYKDMLKMMPEDTLLGRMCIISYIKREEKKIKDIQLQIKNLAE